MAKKTVIKKDAMSKLVDFMSKHQNDKKKLNAGQMREMIKLVLVGLAESLEPFETSDILTEVKTSKFAINVGKEKAISKLEAKLAELKKV